MKIITKIIKYSIELPNEVWGFLKKLNVRDIAPLMLVIPLFFYAYILQSVVMIRSEGHESNIQMIDLASIKSRINAILKTDFANCRDYAHWDDTYSQVNKPKKKWITENLENGLGSIFGFDMAAMINNKGKVIWSRGLNKAKIQSIHNYRLLQRCAKKKNVRGLFILSHSVYLGTAVSIRKSSNKGKPHGIIIVGRLMNPQVAGSLNNGIHKVFHLFRSKTLQPSIIKNNHSLELTHIVCGEKILDPNERLVLRSDNKQILYGVLSVHDINGVPAGVIVDSSSRANFVSNLRVIKNVSYTLMFLCILLGIIGGSWFRHRNIAQRIHKDPLTDLYNHGYLQEYLKNQLLIAERYKRPLAVLMFDIDHFKVVNDTYGHNAGDMVLKSIANTTIATMRNTDLVARYGGEEFVVIMPETEHDQAVFVSERLRQAVESKVITNESASAPSINVSISIGIASYPEDGLTPAEILSSADIALSGAKITRNTVMTFCNIIEKKSKYTSQIAKLDGFLRDSSISTIRPLVAAIDLRDPQTSRHSEKTAEYAIAIGKEYGLSTQELALTCKASLLHDIGMIGIPDHILTKTSNLTPEEYETIKQHSELAQKILSQSPQLSGVAQIVRSHHERYDGNGYPDGLKGDQIPIISRIVTVADVIDALTSPRSYRKPMELVDALIELQMESGKHFDPKVVEAATRVIFRMLDQNSPMAA